MMTPTHPDVTTTVDLDQSMAAEALPPLPKKRGEPVFQDSWEAEAFAMGNILVKEGLITSRQWMDLMAGAIQSAHASGDPDQGDTYYHHWCTALESFCFQMKWVSPDAYDSLVDRWAQAIAKTPHGVPLAIENADLHGHEHAHVPEHGHLHAHHHGSTPPEHYWSPIHVTRLKPQPNEP
jgi:nitrile hydratase accessory protein